jgi:hypothetical protein
MKHVLVLLSIFCLSVLMIFSLLRFSNQRQKNGFFRLFVRHQILKSQYLDLGANSYYIAGLSGQHIYLGNYTAPLHALVTDYDLKDSQWLNLRRPSDESLKWNAVQLQIDSPDIFLQDNLSRTLLHGNLQSNDWEPYKFAAPPFTKSLAFSQTSFVLRTYDNGKQSNTLTRISSDSPRVNANLQAITKQVDGFFCTDGELLFDKQLHKILYLYYYRNSFIVLDTLLSDNKVRHTIDTNGFTKIQVVTSSDQQSSTFSKPPVMVNRQGAIFNGRLFVWSNIMADNEDEKQFDNSSTFDIYSLSNNQYLGSFYIPNFRGLKLLSFTIAENRFIGLYDHFLISCSMRNPLFVSNGLVSR